MNFLNWKGEAMQHITTTKEQLTKNEMKEMLIKNISVSLKECEDISLLDLILKLLKKSV